MAKYMVDPGYLKKHHAAFTVILNGAKPKRVALHGECTVTKPAGAGGPPQSITVPAPNNSELEWLFNAGHEAIIRVQETYEQETTAANKKGGWKNTIKESE